MPPDGGKPLAEHLQGILHIPQHGFDITIEEGADRDGEGVEHDQREQHLTLDVDDKDMDLWDQLHQNTHRKLEHKLDRHKRQCQAQDERKRLDGQVDEIAGQADRKRTAARRDEVKRRGKNPDHDQMAVGGEKVERKEDVQEASARRKL